MCYKLVRKGKFGKDEPGGVQVFVGDLRTGMPTEILEHYYRILSK